VDGVSIERIGELGPSLRQAVSCHTIVADHIRWSTPDPRGRGHQSSHACAHTPNVSSPHSEAKTPFGHDVCWKREQPMTACDFPARPYRKSGRIDLALSAHFRRTSQTWRGYRSRSGGSAVLGYSHQPDLESFIDPWCPVMGFSATDSAGKTRLALACPSRGPYGRGRRLAAAIKPENAHFNLPLEIPRPPIYPSPPGSLTWTAPRRLVLAGAEIPALAVLFPVEAIIPTFAVWRLPDRAFDTAGGGIVESARRVTSGDSARW
jgi:hypothetical protein